MMGQQKMPIAFEVAVGSRVCGTGAAIQTGRTLTQPLFTPMSNPPRHPLPPLSLVVVAHRHDPVQRRRRVPGLEHIGHPRLVGAVQAEIADDRDAARRRAGVGGGAGARAGAGAGAGARRRRRPRGRRRARRWSRGAHLQAQQGWQAGRACCGWHALLGSPPTEPRSRQPHRGLSARPTAVVGEDAAGAVAL
jgi:hypothetical protein